MCDFFRSKPDDTFRMILNMKKLNEYVETLHFNMESIKNVLCIIEPGAWMTSVDLKYEFFMIPIHSDYQECFQFTQNIILFKFNRMPNGCSDAMWVFTKVLKAGFPYLREI